MILYNKTRNSNSNSKDVRKRKPIYQLKIYNSATKREIALSEYVRNNIPFWSNFFLPICEVKTTTVRDIYQQTTDLFSTSQQTSYVLVQYNFQNDKQHKMFADFFTNIALPSLASLPLNQLGDIIYTFQNMINILHLLKEHSIVFLGLNGQNINIAEDRSCMLVQLCDGIIYRGNMYQQSEKEKENANANAIFYPIEYHFMRYMIENNIDAPTIETIDNVWNEWTTLIINTNTHIVGGALRKLKQRFIDLLYPFLNKKRENVCEYLSSSSLVVNWNIYGLNILYLRLLYRCGVRVQSNALICSFIEILLCFDSLEDTAQKLNDLLEFEFELDQEDHQNICSLLQKNKKENMNIVENTNTNMKIKMYC